MTAAAPAPATRLDVHVGELRQLFNSLDPAPFRERDLDPDAERFIVEWGRETRAEGREPSRALRVVVGLLDAGALLLERGPLGLGRGDLGVLGQLPAPVLQLSDRGVDGLQVE